jgi:meiotically up-regulated gene 157 (Mug157) protein
MNRREFIRHTSLLTAAAACNAHSFARAEAAFPLVRTPESARKFTSPAVEKTIQRIKSLCANQELAWMFENCFPNTLDTTVDFQEVDGRPDTYVITGDIDAMWLRDSTAQVWPYLPLMKDDPRLQRLIAGVINRQTRCILKDPYANAFYKNENKVSEWKSDRTDMKPGVHERKWEIDSLCYPVRLAYHYWKLTRDTAPLDTLWHDAAVRILETFREQQRKTDKGPYRFQRRTEVQSDTVALGGYGNPGNPVGLIFSMFRPSDDATIFPFLVPSNAFAVVSLRQAAVILDQLYHDPHTAGQCRDLADQVDQALLHHAIVDHPEFGSVYAYEVDAFGNYYCIDDGNVPSLLSLPYIGALRQNSRVYHHTRRLVLSQANPYYCQGKAANGPGGPHVGRDMIWPLGLIVQGLTSSSDSEIRQVLDTLRRTHAGTGFMHEAFHKDDPKKFTRAWFAWANTIFGELVLKTANERPHLLK